MPRLLSSVTVRVPATSANLGPGFDCLGIALQLFNDVTLATVGADGAPVAAFAVTAVGEGADSLPLDATNLVARGVRLAFHAAGYAQAAGEEGWAGLPPVHMHLINRIPIAAGLGSSSAAIVAGLLAGLTLTGTCMQVGGEERMLQLAASVEGHVDNLAPCIYGGCQIGVHTGSRYYTSSVPIPPGLQCILFIPTRRQSTEGARAVLPPAISRADAIFNIGRAAMLVNAFATGQLGDLALATEDALHQPVRAGIMPAMMPCIAAARAAGALGAFLSGAGSSILALTAGRKGDPHSQSPGERRDMDVARAMVAGARSVGMEGRVLITQPCAGLGAHVIELDGDEGAVVTGRGLKFLEKEEEEAAAGAGAAGAAGTAGAGAAQPGPLPTLAPPATATGAGALAEDCAWVARARGGCENGQAPILYTSTRGGASLAAPLTFASVVFAGTALDGGLYVPTRTPKGCLTPALLDALEGLPYHRVAARLLALWVTEAEIPLGDLLRLTGAAYSEARWGGSGEGEGRGGAVAPLVPLAPASATAPRVDVVELFHGPTAAFKDAALQLLGCLIPYLMSRPRSSAAAAPIPTRVTVLGATSGDTGAAAVAGLRGAQGVTLVILHPAGKVAPVQAMQMCSVLDANVHNVAVGGGADFDACQGAVKGAFADPAFVARHSLCAINSINWARVLAQSIYYVFSFVAWRGREKRAGRGVAPENFPTFVVPTGNFGNALAGYYAAQMLSQPLPPILAATNANDAVHRALSLGDYARGAAATQATLAPSMDISISSNFERALYHAALQCSGGDVAAACARTAALQAGLAASVREGRAGCNPLAQDLRAALAASYTSASADNGSIDSTIAAVLAGSGYALCPHTAAGYAAAAAAAAAGAGAASSASYIVLATAHPAKFASGTPALATPGGMGARYAAEVEGVVGSGGGGGEGECVPPLPVQLRGLHRKPLRCLSLKMGEGGAQGLCEAVMGLCDAVVGGVV